MDIPKYIGLFLVKNKYCSITGLGSLELIRKGASQQGEGMEAPRYDIKFKNLSSIDDQFPNFIGVQENISSNNATNAINKFSKEVKATIASGQPFVIDGIGRFVGQGDKVSFQPVSEFDAGEFTIVPPIVTPSAASDNTRNSASTQVTEAGTYGYTAAEKKGFSFGKILVPILALGVLSGLIYFGYNYMNKDQESIKEGISNQESTPALAADTVSADTAQNIVAVPADTTKKDTIKATTNLPGDTAKKVATADTTKKPAFVGPAMNVVTRTYDNQASADVYAKKLKSYGRNTSVSMKDSATFQVIINFDKTDKPAAEVIDDVRKNYNPGDKYGKVEAAN